jgi:hypothetical protein
MTAPATPSRLQVQRVGLADAWGLVDTRKTGAGAWVRTWTGPHARSTAGEHMDRVQRRLARAARTSGRGR